MNNNEFKGKNINSLQDSSINRNKTIDESLYNESYDTNDNIELFTNLGNNNKYTLTPDQMSYSNTHNNKSFDDSSFGTFS